MCTFKITNCPENLYIDDFLPLGGPDGKKTIESDGVYYTHHLLSITGEKTLQPIKYNDKIYMLLGEVYNYDKNLPSDIYYVIKMYETYGEKFYEHLDGEYLIIVKDKNEINFFTDIWSTRQIWYGEFDSYFYFSTMPLSEKSMNRFNHIHGKRRKIETRLQNNSHYVFNLINKKLTLKNDCLYQWNLDQYKEDLNDWNEAFEEAVVKRWHPNLLLGLSGGLDSTAIALCLSDKKLKFNSLNINFNEAEDMQTYLQACLYTKDYNDRYIIKKEKLIGNNKQTNRLDEAGIRNHPFGTLVRFTNKLNCKVLMTGQGADEIMCNYMHKPVYPESEFKVWPNDLRDIFPYSHFYGGYQRDLIDKHEYIALTYGIECRSVFLDKKLTQEWLNLVPSIKNMAIKYPLVQYLNDRGIHIPNKIAYIASQKLL